MAFVAACSGSVGPGDPEGGFARNGTVSLRYIVDFPEGDGPFPVVVYGPGSGAVSTFHPTLREHARQLVSLGFAVVRYDKRGVGESDGELLSLSTANSEEVIPTLAADMRAVLSEALTLPRIDPQRVGLFGVSQANWYMPLVAEADSRVDWVIVLTGGLLPVGPKSEWERLVFVEGRDPFASETLNEWAEYDGPLGFDQRPALRNSERPFLYLMGGRDPGVPLVPMVTEAEALLAEGVDVTMVTFADGEHLLPGFPFWGDVAAWLGAIE